jgi:hypothetical protein
MIKPASLREALIACNPALANAPETLYTFIEKGTVASSVGKTNGWRYHYTLNLLLTDFAGHPDSLFAPLIAWVRAHQPDLLLNQDDRKQIEFEVEVLDNETYDISIKLPLSESVVLSDVNGQLTATHMPEPKLDDYPEGITWELMVGGVAWGEFAE